jgi:hypothetical protein
MKRLRILGLAILIIVAVAFAIDFAIKSSSRASPANSVSLLQSFLGLYRGDVGFWVTGVSVSTPVTDWSFTDVAQTVLVETRTWYLIPHFVRTFIARNDSQLYLFSEYFAPAAGQPDLRDHFPEARFWNRMVVRDPRIRVKIGNRVFKMRAYAITDENEKRAAQQAFFSKYPDVGKQEALPESQRPRLHFFHLEPGWNDRS